MVKKVLFLFLVILVHALLTRYKYYSVDLIQQDNYVGYAKLLSNIDLKHLSEYDKRLFPGLPLFIALISQIFRNELISGIVIIIFSLIIVYSITHYFTKSPIYSFWITIFPPIIFEQTSKISTEAVTISSILSAYYFVSKLKYYRASLVLSLSSIVRPISFFLFLAMICQLCRKYKIKVAFYCLIIYLSFPVFLIFFNYYHWGLGSLFIQIIAYNDFSRGTFGLKQLIVDIPRTIEWGQPKILFSGISYILFTLFILYKTIRVKTDFIFKNDNLLIKIWSISSIIFIFAIGPTPFLEELRRYLCIIFPLLLLIHFKIIFSRKLLFYSSFLFIIYTFIK